MKRIAIIILLLLLAATGAYFLIPRGERFFLKDQSLYEAVPVTVPFFFEFSSLKAIPGENFLPAEWQEAGIAKKWIDKLVAADTLIGSIEGISNGLKSSPFICAFGYTGRNVLIPMVLAKSESPGREQSFKQLLQELYPPGQYNYSEKAYGNYTITVVESPSDGSELFFAFGKDLFLASPASILVEEALRQVSAPGILKDPYFRQVNTAAARNDFTLFVNHSALSGFFSKLLMRTSAERTDEFGALRRIQPLAAAGKFNHFAGWSRLGVEWQDEQLLMNGLSGANDSLNHFLAVFQDQQPVRMHAEELLPRNTSWFCSFAFQDKDAFFDRLEAYCQHAPNYYPREERMKRFDQGFRADVRKAFREIIRNELIVATSVIPVNPANKTTYLIMQTAGRSAGEELLHKLLENYTSRREVSVDSLMTSLSFAGGEEHSIYRFPYPSFPGLWIGSPFAVAEANFVTIYDDLMVFSNTEQGLQEYLRNRLMGTTLNKALHNRTLLPARSIRANMLVFADVNRAFSIRTELFTPALLKQIEKDEELIRKGGTIQWQMRREKSSYVHSLVVNFRAASDADTQTLWQTALGSTLRTKPELVINHYDRSNQEIIFQDQLNQISLVSANGHVRWTLPLQEPVLSDIHQIDFYRNGKLQYLFNTREKLYLIDRNGNDAAHFPISLPTPATNGVAVFDYDRNRSYRFFIAGEKNRIHAYDEQGKDLTGWKFEKTSGVVKTPLQHFRVDGNDYITVTEESELHILNRQGEQRVQTPEGLQMSVNPLALIPDSEPKIAGTDRKGRVHYFFPDGNHKVVSRQEFSENHYFAADDLDGDGIADFIFVDGNAITVTNEQGKRMFSKNIGNPIVTPPAIYTFSDRLKKVGVVDASGNLIYLFGPGGNLHSGFPMTGNSRFTIGKLTGQSDAFNLLVGSAGGMLLNYQLPQ